ncbi:MAG TPA: hypothetical protein DD727_00850 [Clostridiales bacterium]|nr:hypothetical protein [Clostridiales bacterium]
MSILIDLGLIVFLLLFAVIGWKRGFVKSVTGFASSIVSTIVAIVLYKPFAALMKTTPLFGSIRQNILSNLMKQQSSMLSAGTRFEEGAETMLRDNLGLPEFLSGMVSKWVPNPAALVTRQEIAETISTHLAGIAIDILSLVLILILARVGMIFARGVLSIFTKLPVIHQVDSMLGLLAAGLQAFLILFLIMTALLFLASSPSFKGFFDLLDRTWLTKALYQLNPLAGLMFLGWGAS